MKSCPFCAEQIQDDAIKCRFCNEFLDGPRPAPKPAKAPWYYSSTSLVVSFLAVGPLMLPLVWLKPGMSRQARIIATLVILAITAGAVAAMQWSYSKLNDYYKLMAF